MMEKITIALIVNTGQNDNTYDDDDDEFIETNDDSGRLVRYGRY